MIYILIIIVAVKYRYIISDIAHPTNDEDEVYEILKPGAGIEYQEPQKRNHLRAVK
jgi:hypothetical protein